MEITTTSTKQTQELAQQLSEKLSAGNVVALYGDLGAGKTTFTRFLVGSLGFDARVQSPTFVLIRNYKNSEGKIKSIYHIDLYRLTSPEEAEDLGLAEMFSEPDAISIIEWPELVEASLPKDTIKIYFEYADENSRKINVQNIS